MKNKNCPNCGAPYSTEVDKCPYCGTSYFDLSCIDFDASEPIYLKIKYKNMIITQCVKPVLNSIEVSSESTYINGGLGRKLTFLPNNREIRTQISFVGIPDKNNNLLTIVTEEE